jgi:site-specific recombinase XerD
MQNDIEQFLLWLKATGRKDIKGYGYAIKLFAKFMQDQGVGEVSQLNSQHIEAWTLYQPHRTNKKGLPISPVSINNGYSRLRLFLGYLYKRGKVTSKLGGLIVGVKEPKILPTSLLNDDDMNKFLNGFDSSTAIGYRNKTMALTMYSSGMRVGELCGLNFDSINYNDGTVLVFGKGSKERLIPIGSQALNMIESYVRAIRPFFIRGNSSNALFISSRAGKRLTTNAVQSAFRDVAKKTAFKGITPHSMRRSFATSLIRAGDEKEGINLVHLKDMLGHESFDQISKYVKLSPSDLVKSHKKYHPRG